MNSTKQTKQTQITLGTNVHYSNYYLFKHKFDASLPQRANNLGKVVSVQENTFTVEWENGEVTQGLLDEDLGLTDSCKYYFTETYCDWAK